jgi:hypothetical protein
VLTDDKVMGHIFLSAAGQVDDALAPTSRMSRSIRHTGLSAKALVR